MISRVAFLLLILAETGFSASIKPSPDQIDLFSKTIDWIFTDSFDQAYRLAGEIQDTVDGRPLYNLLYASILHSRMMDMEDYSDEKTFMTHINKSIDSFEKWCDKNPDDAWGRFFLGSAYGYKSLIYAQKRSWLKSMLNGLKAKSNFAKAIERDSTLYDAYTGMGNYHYWSSVKLGKYIPFFPDNREKGIDELKLAADSSYFSKKPAEAGLAWAFIEEKDLNDAVKIGLSMYKQTHGGRNSLWILGGVYWRMGNLPLAASYYGELAESYLREGKQNNYNLIFCHYRLGVCLYGTGKYDKAKAEFDKILSYEVSRKIRKRHEKTYDKTREYLSKIEKRKKRD